MSLSILNSENKKVGEIALAVDVNAKVKKAVLYYAVKAGRNALRHGTACVKDRADVKMTNKKIYRQKGTGGARHAARSANLFVGGGSAHGPRPRSYVESVNRSFQKVAYVETFRHLLKKDAVKVIDKISFEKPSTKSAVSLLKTLNITECVVILTKDNLNAKRSLQNIKGVKVIHEENINVLDLCTYECVLMTSDTFGRIKERYAL